MQKIAGFRLVIAFLPFVLGAETASRNTLSNQYCLVCHNERVKSGGLALDGIPSGDPSAHSDVWEKVIRKIRAGEMPPAGMPRPDEASLTALTAGLIDQIDAADVL